MSELFERFSCNWSDDSVRIINTPSQLAKNLYYYIQEIGHFKTTYPYFTERKQLNSFLLIYTLSGSGQLTIHGRSVQLKPGQLCFIHCMEPHLYQTLKGREWEFLWVHFQGPDVLGFYNEFKKRGLSVFDAANDGFYHDALLKLLTLCQGVVGSELKISQTLYEILTTILLRFSSGVENQISLSEPVSLTLQEIERNFSSDLSLDLLAEKAHISKYHLCREFKKYTDLSIGEAIIVQRITHAKELLKYSGASVSEISAACGFHQISHFIQLFKARENTTPLSYKKEWKDAGN